MKWINEGCQDDINIIEFFPWQREDQEAPELLQSELLKIHNVAANLDGCGLLASLFWPFGEVHYEENEDDGEPTSEQLVEIFINHIKLLEPAREDNSYSPPPFQPSYALPESSYSAAFERDYMDPHGLISHYSREISAMMEEWVNNPKKYVAPYTSVVTSSMMGKSRLIKELAMKIPTVYICLRINTNDSGYPIAST